MIRQNSSSRRSHYAITPDIQAIHFSVGKQRTNHTGSNKETEAIFEAKMITVCKSRYICNNNNRTVPVVYRSARVAVSSYSMKFKTPDFKFAEDKVGDWKVAPRGRLKQHNNSSIKDK
jgi:hypothetical protein